MSLPPAAGPLASLAGTTSGPFGKVPWELSPSPSRAVRRRGCGCGAFRHTGPRAAFLPRHPRQDGWGKGTATGHTIPARVPLWLPSPARGDTHPSCPAPSHGSIAPGVFLPPCRKRSSPCFSPAGPPSQRCARPAPFQARRLCAQPAFFQPSRHLCAKKNDFVKKNANTGLSPPSLPDKSACSPPKAPRKQGQKIEKIKK